MVKDMTKAPTGRGKTGIKAKRFNAAGKFIERTYKIKDGMVQVPEKDFRTMRERIEDMLDMAALDHALANQEEMIDGAVLKAILAGENAVRAFRKYRGLTQSGLADDTGLSQAMIAKIENGADGSISSIKKIAEALDVDIDHLV